ncbi:hypothetical protein VCR15J2_460013 [Vibrio coralliirubri]|nr:hypothetical protein VCR15J2_460013 [Vibrio coralliirubri]
MDLGQKAWDRSYQSIDWWGYDKKRSLVISFYLVQRRQNQRHEG